MEIRSRDELMAQDSRVAHFSPYGLSLGLGDMKPDAQLRWLQEDSGRYDLGDHVPAEVRGYFDVARLLHVYGFFAYEFFTVAHERSTLAAEMALRVRFIEEYSGEVPVVRRDGLQDVIKAAHYWAFDEDFRRGKHRHRDGWRVESHPDFNGDLGSLLDWAEAKGLIAEGFRQAGSGRSGYLEGLRTLRNLIAHPAMNTMVMPPDSSQSIEWAWVFISGLWSSVGSIEQGRRE